MGWQVNPSLSAEAIMKILTDTSYEWAAGIRIIDPGEFIAAVKAGRGQK
jgi:hypothetical protein